MERRPTKDIVLARIPAFPPVILRLLDLLANDSTDVALLVKEIASDPTLASQILRTANSPLFGFASQIDTVQHAVVALGFSRVQALTMAVATSNYMKAALKTEALHRCWRHTLASAILCQEVARAASVAADRAYTLGLLHDIGRLGLLVAFPAEYAQLLKDEKRPSHSLLEEERSLFGVDHCEAGQFLMEQWNMPPEFCAAVARHHEPPQTNDLDLHSIVHLGCQLADTLGYSVIASPQVTPFDEVRSLLPGWVQPRFPADSALLTDMIDRAIGGPEPLIVVMPEPCPDVSDLPADGGPSIGTDPARWDFTVVAIAAVVFVIILIAFSFFWKL
jgi:HD-like signal output (HDOD) protein